LILGRAVGIFFVVDEELLSPFVKIAAFALHRILFGENFGIAKAPERQLPWGERLGGVVALMLDRWSPLDHQHLQPSFSQFLGSPPAGNAGAYHNDIVFGVHWKFTAIQSLLSSPCLLSTGMSAS